MKTCGHSMNRWTMAPSKEINKNSVRAVGNSYMVELVHNVKESFVSCYYSLSFIYILPQMDCHKLFQGNRFFNSLQANEQFLLSTISVTCSLEL